MAWNTSMGLATRLKTPQRTQGIVAAAAKRREGGRSEADHTLNQLRGQLAQAKKHVRNLLDALADGLAGESDLFKEKLSQAESERAELTNLIEAQEAQIKDALKPISIEEAKVASANLKRLIEAAPADLKKRYVRAFVSEIVVGKSEIVISWPKDALAEAVTGTPPAHIAAASGPVRSLVREWRTLREKDRTSCSKFWPNGISYLAPSISLQTTPGGRNAGFEGDEEASSVLAQAHF